MATNLNSQSKANINSFKKSIIEEENFVEKRQKANFDHDLMLMTAEFEQKLERDKEYISADMQIKTKMEKIRVQDEIFDMQHNAVHSKFPYSY